MDRRERTGYQPRGGVADSSLKNDANSLRAAATRSAGSRSAPSPPGSRTHPWLYSATPSGGWGGQFEQTLFGSELPRVRGLTLALFRHPLRGLRRSIRANTLRLCATPGSRTSLRRKRRIRTLQRIENCALIWKCGAPSFRAWLFLRYGAGNLSQADQRKILVSITLRTRFRERCWID